MAGSRGFTLIELLVVCAILAALACTAWGGYQGVREDAEDEVALADLRRLADALRRFKADTGFYPGQGPFVLSMATADSCTASDGILRSWAPPSLLDDDARAWFASPANLGLLFDAPPLCAKHPLAHLKKWNPESGRGWHGPYLDRNLRRWVDHGAELNLPDGSGSPLVGEKILDVPAYGSGPRYAAAGPSASCTHQADKTGNCMLGWRTTPRWMTGYNAKEHELARHARPFLFFGPTKEDAPRVIYFGKDGAYGGRNAADLDPCRPAPRSDDIVLCLPG